MKKTFCYSVVALVMFSLIAVPSTTLAFFPGFYKPFKTEVVNDETNPVPVTIINGYNDASQTFNLCIDTFDTYHMIHENLLDVPEDKMAVVEYASFRAASDTYIRYVYVYLYDSGTRYGKHYLAMTPHGIASGRQDFVGNSSIRLYAQPGTRVSFEAWREPGYSETFSGEMCISGYYVDITE